jgi:hypothetical protein
MRLPPLPVSEYEGRIARLQAEMARAGVDVLVSYSSESESAASRFLAGFSPFFDFSSAPTVSTVSAFRLRRNAMRRARTDSRTLP